MAIMKKKSRRPDSSFLWIWHPVKAIKYALWHHYRYLFVKVFILICLMALLVLFVYAVPGYAVKKILDA